MGLQWRKQQQQHGRLFLRHRRIPDRGRQTDPAGERDERDGQHADVVEFLDSRGQRPATEPLLADSVTGVRGGEL